ncbi:MAG TPA: MATE family efflux transporter, partial [Bacteroidales bacterium]|nr:MATE family efflux transporter [Bacteroidales bacterium]
MGEEKIFKLFLRFSIPAILGMIVQSLYNIVDRIFIGNIPEVGGLAISGIGVILPITFIIMGFAMLFGIGSGANISIKLGENKKDDAEKIFGAGFFMLIAVGLAITIIGLLFLDQIVNLYGADDSIRSYATDYFRIILYGNVFSTIAFGLNNIIRSEGNAKIAMFSMLIGAITNMVLDPILIYGFNMGVAGAAYATIIDKFMSFLWTIRYYLCGKSMLKLRRAYIHFNPALVVKIMSIGASPFAMQAAGSVIGIIMNQSLSAYGGPLAIGAFAAINSVVILFFMPIFGMNQGLQPIIGFNYGAKNYQRVKDALKVGIIAATAVCTFGFILIQLFPHAFINFISSDPDIREMGVEGLRRFMLLMPVIGMQIISSNFFQAIGMAKKAFVLSMLRQVIFLIPLILILPRYLGLIGLWTAVPISDFFATVATLTVLYFQIRTLNREEKIYREERKDEIEERV